MSILDMEEISPMILSSIPRVHKKHVMTTTSPCLVIDFKKKEKYMVTQTKCVICGKVFEEKKEMLK